jgi:hypothetical protein
MAIIQTTSRKFRDKQKDFFELADKGEKILIRRGKKRAYLLTSVDEGISILLSPCSKKLTSQLNRQKKEMQQR